MKVKKLSEKNQIDIFFSIMVILKNFIEKNFKNFKNLKELLNNYNSLLGRVLKFLSNY